MSTTNCTCSNGQCVPNPLIDSPSQPKFLCLCNQGFSGRADYFDQRVFINSTIELSLDCQVSDVGTTIIWTLFFLIFILRLALTALSLKKFGGTNKKKLRPMTAKLLIVDIFASLLAITLPIQKLADPKNSVLGTSAPATLVQVFSVIVMNFVWSMNQVEEFKMLSNVKTWKQLRAHPLGKLHLELQAGFMIAYFIVGIISLIALGLDKALGPIQSNEVVVLILRNIGFLLWSLFVYHGSSMMQMREKSSRNLLLHVQGGERPLRVVDYLQRNKRGIKRQVVAAAVLYIIFSLPPLWEQQYINIGLTMSFLALSSNVGHILLSSERAAYHTKGSSGENGAHGTTGTDSTQIAGMKPGANGTPPSGQPAQIPMNSPLYDLQKLVLPVATAETHTVSNDPPSIPQQQKQQLYASTVAKQKKPRDPPIIAAYAMHSGPDPSY
jgi:hypothetical protein